MDQQLFRSRKSLWIPEKPQFSRPGTEILNDCIATTHSQIFAIKRRMTALNANILTICRCIQTRLPAFSLPFPIRLPKPKEPQRRDHSFSPKNWGWLDIFRRSNSQFSTNSKLRIPASLVVPEAERAIAPPESIDMNDMTLMTSGQPKLQVQLNLLVLKKAELEVKTEKLARDFLFWGGIYEEIKVVHHPQNQEELPCSENLPYSPLKRISKPTLLCGTLVNCEFTHGKNSGSFSIPRKEVPVGEILARVKTSPLDSNTERESTRNQEARLLDQRSRKGTHRMCIHRGISNRHNFR